MIRLAEMLADKLLPGARDCFPFLRMLEIILADPNDFLGFGHDEMFAGHEWSETLAGLGNDAAAVGQPDEHAVPLEVAQLRIMQVEENL